MEKILTEKITAKVPISKQEAKWLFEKASPSLLQELSQAVRRRYHKDSEATYLIMGIVNLTNICVARCDYCAFYKLPGENGGYLLPKETLYQRLKKIQQKGGTLVSLNSGFHPGLTIDRYAEIFEPFTVNFRI